MEPNGHRAGFQKFSKGIRSQSFLWAMFCVNVGQSTQMKTYSVAPLTGILKPKYRRITDILGENYNPEKGIDVFIDLNTFVSTMSSSAKFMSSLPFSGDVEKDIVSSILMLLKHWKDYLRKWDSRIFLMFNDFELGNLPERDILKAYLVPYVNKFKNERFQQLVYYWNESVKILEPLMDFIPKAYFIRCNKFDSMILPEIIDDYDKNGRDRLIISGSSMMSSYAFQPNTKMIYTCYRYQGSTQLSDPLMMIQTFTKIDEQVMEAFIKNKVFYNLLNTILGDKDRGIIGLTQFGITTFATDLLRSVEKRQVPINPKSIDSVLPVIDKAYHDYLKKNYPLVDLTLHAQMVKPSIVAQTRARMIDKSDIDALMNFSINGLNLMELL